MLSFINPSWVTLATLITATAAQTFTSCNPLEKSCPSNPGLTEKTFSTDFTQGNPESWHILDGTTLAYSNAGAAFTVKTKTDAPTIETEFYILFGYIEVKAKAAPGTGIVSSIVLQSDDLDEVDWEFLGGIDNSVQSNFYGKGNTTTYDRMVQLNVNQATEQYHTYALNWTSSSLTWLIDGVPLRTVKYTDALALGGKNYPQTPCRVKLGSWAGGASASPGTVTWAGGATDFSQGPFHMYIDSVKITNYNPSSSYSYSDNSGSYQSIKMDQSTSVPDTSSDTTSSSSSLSTISVTIGTGSHSATSDSSATVTATKSATSSVTTILTSASTSASASVSSAFLTSTSKLASSQTSTNSPAVSSYVPGNNAAGLTGSIKDSTARTSLFGFLVALAVTFVY